MSPVVRVIFGAKWYLAWIVCFQLKGLSHTYLNPIRGPEIPNAFCTCVCRFIHITPTYTSIYLLYAYIFGGRSISRAGGILLCTGDKHRFDCPQGNMGSGKGRGGSPRGHADTPGDTIWPRASFTKILDEGKWNRKNKSQDQVYAWHYTLMAK
jgi:hypothetical protein